MPFCAVCNRQATADLLESHHQRPRATNGSDDSTNLIDICPICHTSAHHLSKLLTRSQSESQNFLNVNYPGQPKAHELLIKLAETIILETDKDIVKSHVNVPYKPDHETHRMLKDMAKASRINMHDFLTSLIKAEWRRRKFGPVESKLRKL